MMITKITEILTEEMIDDLYGAWLDAHPDHRHPCDECEHPEHAEYEDIEGIILGDPFYCHECRARFRYQ